MKRIHVNVNVIRHNKKYGNTLPACRISEGSVTKYCREVEILGPSRMVYRPDAPLACGAKCWIETDASVNLIGEVLYSTIAKSMKEIAK